MPSTNASLPTSIKSEPEDEKSRNPLHFDGWKLVGVVITLNAANGVAFVDLLGVTAILPAVSDHFTTGDTIAWAATTQLIGATIGLAILGYLSDVWSRRLMLLIALGLLLISALACGLSHYQPSADVFSALRTFSGIATGSISNLVNIAQNDFLPVRKRLKYQGVQGTSIALGSILGMMAGAAWATKRQWQYLYYLEAGLSFCAATAVFFFVPPNCTPPNRNQVMGAIKKIDFAGIFSGIGFAVPGLLLLSRYHSLDTITLIVLAVITGISAVVFLTLGFLPNRCVRPLVPFRLFRNRTIATILLQNVLFGATYYSFNYYMPLNLQVVREMPAIQASAYQIPYYVCHGITSTVSALVILQLQNRGMRSYSIIFLVGFAVWTAAMVCLAFDSEYQIQGLAIFLMVLVGIGTGSSFQNSVMAISAEVDSDTKGVAVGTRNILRFFGGALGTAISSTIFRNRLDATMPFDQLPEEYHVTSSAFSHHPFERLSDAQRNAVQESYDGAIAWVFYVSAIFVGLCFLLCPLIRDGQKTTRSVEEGVKVRDKDVQVEVEKDQWSPQSIASAELHRDVRPPQPPASILSRPFSWEHEHVGNIAQDDEQQPSKN